MELTSSNKWLNVEQAAAYLGIKVSTLYVKVCHAELPFYKPSHRLFFKQEELDEYIERSRCATVAELMRR